MTTSITLNRLAAHLPSDAYTCRYLQDALDAFCDTCKLLAKKIVFLSSDSEVLTREQAERDGFETMGFFFEDGSFLAIDNPDQGCGPAEVWR